MANIRIALADDHAILRAGLLLLIDTAPDLEVVGQAADAEQALALVRERMPDVLVLDISMPGGGALETLAKLDDEHPTVRVLVLTMHRDETYLRACLAAGAAGYLVKSAADDQLLDAIRTVHEGRAYIGMPGQGPVQTHASTVASPQARRLSVREGEVLEQLAYGLTNQEIAARMGVGVKSVESYRARLYEKLGFQGRRDLVRYAVATGLLSPERLHDAEM